MGPGIAKALRRRMYATIALFVVCAASFVGALAVLYGWVVPALLRWWATEFDVSAGLGWLAVLVPAGVVLWLAIGTVRNLYASPLGETNAKSIDRENYPALHDTVQRLAVQADVPPPSLALVPSDVPNAYTVGVTPERSTIVVTEGLLEELDADEQQAVLAHELAHVTNRDGAVMSVGYLLPAVSFAVTKALTSPFDRNDRPSWHADDSSSPDENWGTTSGRSSTRTRSTLISLTSGNSSTTGSSSYGGSSSSSDDDGGGILVAILVLLAILVATAVLTLAIATFFWAFSYLTLILLARTREYAADWGAVELTGDPDALVSALTKIDGEMDDLPVEDLREVDGAVETLYFAPLRRGVFKRRDVLVLSDDLFPKTHPDTEDRIDRILETATDH